MASEEFKDSVNNMDWKKVSNAAASDSSMPFTKKRLPKKLRQVPDYYFLPRRSLPSAFAIYGACCTAGVGAGMILEVWIKKKSKGMPAFQSYPQREDRLPRAVQSKGGINLIYENFTIEI